MGGSRPNQNNYVFSVILVSHPKSYIEKTDHRCFGKPSEWRRGRVLSWKIPEFSSMGEARSKNSIFRVFYGTLQLSCTQPTGNSLTPNQWYQWKAKTLKVCLLLVWRVCDQAFGRYIPLKSAKKWSHDHKNWKVAYGQLDTRRKIHWFQKCYFRSTAKNNEVIAEKPFPNSAWPSWIDARCQYILLVIIIIRKLQ